MMPVRKSAALACGVLFLVAASLAFAQTQVTLSPAASPNTGQPGVTTIFIVGSNFPAGVISPSGVSVKVTPSGGTAVSTPAVSVTTVSGTIRRVGFVVPSGITVQSPTASSVSLSGATTGGVKFASGNSVSITVLPPPSIASVVMNSAVQGASIQVTITGNYTNFVSPNSVANFGAGISVGGAAPGTNGPINVMSATSATAQLNIAPTASLGARTVTVKTGNQTATAANGFSVLQANRPPIAAPGGPYTGQTGQAVHFDGSASTDPDNDPLSYAWDFGDGSTGSGATINHVYDSAGTFPVALTVNDGRGGSNTAITQARITAGTGGGDTTPPTVSITSPNALTLFNTAAITVSGAVNDTQDPSPAVSVNGIDATVANGAFTATNVPLREGNNILTATGTDSAGNVGTATVSVVLDTTAPTLRIDSPADGAVVTTSTVTVTGIVNDAVPGTVNAAQVTVTINGANASVSNRSFSAADIPLVRGLNVIAATARDQAGNQNQTQVSVTLQDTTGQQHLEIVSGNNQTGQIRALLPQPLLVRLLDANNAPVSGRQITFTVQASDGMLRSLGTPAQQVTAVSDDNGQATVQFQLGSRVGIGINQVQVSSPGVAGQAIFSESSTVGPPAQINIVSGDRQRGASGQPLPEPFVVVVFDEGGNAVSNANVTFKVTAGDCNFGGNASMMQATDQDGKAAAVLTAGLEEGINNDVTDASIGNLHVTFMASSVAAGDPKQTTVSGVVLDNANMPIPNATAKIVGTDLRAVSDDQGRFTISNAPVGTIALMVDGSSSTRPETFPFLNFQLTTIAGQDNTVGGPIYLPPIDTTNSKIVGGDQDVVLTMNGVQGYQFTIPAHSATFPDGSHVGRMSLSQVHSDKVPMIPPNGSAPRLAGTLQPPGVHFDPPIKVQFPNVDSLAPGTVVDIYTYDHDLEQFVSQGPGRVSSDGSVIVSDAGFGITKSGWHFGPPPPPPKTCVGSPPPCQKCDTNTGSFVSDSSQNGNACGDSPQNFDTACGTSKVNIKVGDGCKGTCKDGSCGNDPFGIKQASDAVNSAIGKMCDGCGGKMGDALKKTLTDNLTKNGFNVVCDKNADPNDCAFASPGSNTLTLTPSSLKPGCDDLGSSSLHEMIHALANFRHRKCNDAGDVLGEIACPGPKPAEGCKECVDPDTDKSYGCEAACYGAAGSSVGKASACK